MPKKELDDAFAEKHEKLAKQMIGNFINVETKRRRTNSQTPLVAVDTVAENNAWRAELLHKMHCSLRDQLAGNPIVIEDPAAVNPPAAAAVASMDDPDDGSLLDDLLGEEAAALQGESAEWRSSRRAQ